MPQENAVRSEPHGNERPSLEDPNEPRCVSTLGRQNHEGEQECTGGCDDRIGQRVAHMPDGVAFAVSHSKKIRGESATYRSFPPPSRQAKQSILEVDAQDCQGHSEREEVGLAQEATHEHGMPVLTPVLVRRRRREEEGGRELAGKTNGENERG